MTRQDLAGGGLPHPEGHVRTYAKVENGETRFRSVIDMSSLN